MDGRAAGTETVRMLPAQNDSFYGVVSSVYAARALCGTRTDVQDSVCSACTASCGRFRGWICLEVGKGRPWTEGLQSALETQHVARGHLLPRSHPQSRATEASAWRADEAAQRPVAPVSGTMTEDMLVSF